MAHDLFNRYLWLVDTIRRYGRISRNELNRLWRLSAYSDGSDMPRRTFHNYRLAAQELFGIDIKCDLSTYEYYIEGDIDNGGVSDWLLNTAMTHEVISGATDIASRIVVDDVPSAREYLAPAIEAIRENRRIRISYHPYYRSRPSEGIVLEPYFLKLFKQRWYLVGFNVKEGKLKTYALDRIVELFKTPDTFEPDESLNAAEYFRHAFGIVAGLGTPHTVNIKADLRRAKYLRALPLHASQQEYVHDEYSVFSYNLCITDDLIAELLSYGSSIEVLAPKELRLRMTEELRASLDSYKEK